MTEMKKSGNNNRPMNNLGRETSPYLQQHAYNPVNWYPWGEEALDKARKENKMILISIGYSACHWCHVMERESFEDEGIASIMNKHYVCIKVDREERPDVDQVYMTAVQILTGGGGWPLNCFALPNGQPVFGGTYFPKNQWKSIISNLASEYEKNPGKLRTIAEDLTKGVTYYEHIVKKDSKTELDVNLLSSGVEKWKTKFDIQNGGSKGAPKFPMPSSYIFLMEYYYHTKDLQVLDHVRKTLKRISQGGIYDHVGGGFARYAVDNEWKVPHFEKMLYDNAQLVSLYARLYQLTKDTRCQDTVYETLQFVQREMMSPEHGFYSALDADSEGIEGKFYVWEKKEIDSLLRDKSTLFSACYNVKEKGNWEGYGNILYVDKTIEEISRSFDIDPTDFINQMAECREILLEARNKRIRPGLDDKILTSWNGLMLKAFVDAYRIFDDQHFLKIAENNALFIVNNLLRDSFQLYRTYKNGKAHINAFLDDYAIVARAFTELYQATLDKKWLVYAQKLTDYAIAHFYDEKSGMFFYTSDLDDVVVARKMEVNDNVIPSSNSMMAMNLAILGKLFYDKKYLDISIQMVQNISENISNYLNFFAHWGSVYLFLGKNPYQIAFTGKDAHIIRKQFDSEYNPGIVIAGSTEPSDIPILKDRYVEDETYIYVCKDKTCQMPVKTYDEALKQIS